MSARKALNNARAADAEALARDVRREIAADANQSTPDGKEKDRLADIARRLGFKRRAVAASLETIK